MVHSVLPQRKMKMGYLRGIIQINAESCNFNKWVQLFINSSPPSSMSIINLVDQCSNNIKKKFNFEECHFK